MPAEATLERPMPQNLDAEESVLGAMMLNENAVDVVTEIVRPNDFYRESHAVVYNVPSSARFCWTITHSTPPSKI